MMSGKIIFNAISEVVVNLVPTAVQNSVKNSCENSSFEFESIDRSVNFA